MKTGWVTINGQTWWLGNGDITPFNWSENFDESVRQSRMKTPIKVERSKVGTQLTIDLR
jgi:hypothetical protein